jgi:hypothetical protein
MSAAHWQAVEDLGNTLVYPNQRKLQAQVISHLNDCPPWVDYSGLRLVWNHRFSLERADWKVPAPYSLLKSGLVGVASFLVTIPLTWVVVGGLLAVGHFLRSAIRDGWYFALERIREFSNAIVGRKGPLA